MSAHTANAKGDNMTGWTEAYPGGMITKPGPNGGIIYQAVIYKRGRWFIIFNSDNPAIEDPASREEALKVFNETTKIFNAPWKG